MREHQSRLKAWHGIITMVAVSCFDLYHSLKTFRGYRDVFVDALHFVSTHCLSWLWGFHVSPIPHTPEQSNHQVAHYSKEWRGPFPLGSFAEMSGEEYSTDNTPSTVSLLIDWHFWLQSSDSDRKWRQEFVCIKHCNPAVSMLFMNTMKPKSLKHVSTTWVVEMIIRAKRLTSTSSPTSL